MVLVSSALPCRVDVPGYDVGVSRLVGGLFPGAVWRCSLLIGYSARGKSCCAFGVVGEGLSVGLLGLEGAVEVFDFPVLPRIV